MKPQRKTRNVRISEGAYQAIVKQRTKARQTFVTALDVMIGV